EPKHKILRLVMLWSKGIACWYQHVQWAFSQAKGMLTKNGCSLLRSASHHVNYPSYRSVTHSCGIVFVK
uniref:Uncharacterized protein n=1 Tax=Aegilops tauschii subsp. strangulata TaxID=200361 RepID=A0A453C332_AEGTS